MDQQPPHDPRVRSDHAELPPQEPDRYEQPRVDRAPIQYGQPTDSLGQRESASPGHAISLSLSWTAIVLVVGLVFVGSQIAPQVDAEPNAPDPVGLEMMKLQSRALLMQPGGGDAALAQARDTLYGGTIAQRLRFAVLAGEMSGPDAALEILEDTDWRVGENDEVEYSNTEREVRDTLGQLYSDYAAGDFDAESLNQSERDLLAQELDWFGELALYPKESTNTDRRAEVMAPTERFFGVIIAVVLIGGFLGFAGFVGLVALFIMAILRKLPNRIGGPLPHGHIYAETFAVWLAVFLGLQIVALGLPIGEEHALSVSAIAFFLSLIALTWPRMRGVPFGSVRRDIGWTGNIFVEPFVGLGAYAMTLPILGVGIILTLITMLVAGVFTGGGGELADTFGPTGGPAHPIIVSAGEASWWPKFQLYLVAAIAAPIVEETMFRGVLYRHLRSISGRWAIVASIVFSTLVGAFIFAVIHPQGVIAIPALMSLATAMTLAREWRGSIIPSMIIHGVSNGLVMTMLVLLVGG